MSTITTGHGILRAIHRPPPNSHLALRLRLFAPPKSRPTLPWRAPISHHSQTHRHSPALQPTRPQFWLSQAHWRRASLNTLRCLVGCTIGDFGMMWYLQTREPAPTNVTATMALSMGAGLLTSFTLETVLLRLGRDKLASWRVAARTAAGMSLVSMLAMETVQNLVDYHLTGGKVDLGDWRFWRAALLAMTAGYLAPLPYNYLKLRRWGRACH
ncbi:MAG: hypothetical protein M1816_001816 [Peltula sp. TS41687]|nr:MAG: hypothetical protein M1816_001816 [Peltula sp. TS41687]